MRYKSATDWNLYEVTKNEKHPCSDEYADANDEELADIFTALRLLRAAGCPADTSLGSPIIDPIKHKCRSAHTKTAFFVLKAKPSGWRLYFRILDRKQREIEFLYSTHKKTDKRDPNDLDKCCRILVAVLSGKTGRERIYIPPR